MKTSLSLSSYRSMILQNDYLLGRSYQKIIQALVTDPYLLIWSYDIPVIRESVIKMLKEKFEKESKDIPIPFGFLDSEDARLFCQMFQLDPQRVIAYQQLVFNYIKENLCIFFSVQPCEFESRWSYLLEKISSEEKESFIKILFLVQEHELFHQETQKVFFKELIICFRNIYKSFDEESFISLENFTHYLMIEALRGLFCYNKIPQIFAESRDRLHLLKNYFSVSEVVDVHNKSMFFWAQMKILTEQEAAQREEGLKEGNFEKDFQKGLAAFFEAHIADMEILAVFLQSYFPVHQLMERQYHLYITQLHSLQDESSWNRFRQHIAIGFYNLQKQVYDLSNQQTPYFTASTDLENFLNEDEIKEDFFVDTALTRLAKEPDILKKENQQYFLDFIQERHFAFCLADRRDIENLFSYTFKKRLALLVPHFFEVLILEQNFSGHQIKISVLTDPQAMVYLYFLLKEKRELYLNYLNHHFLVSEKSSIFACFLSYQRGEAIYDFCHRNYAFDLIDIEQGGRLSYFFQCLNLNRIAEPNFFQGFIDLLCKLKHLRKRSYQELIIKILALKFQTLSVEKLQCLYQQRDKYDKKINNALPKDLAGFFWYSFSVELLKGGAVFLDYQEEVVDFFLNSPSSLQYVITQNNIVRQLFLRWSEETKFSELEKIMRQIAPVRMNQLKPHLESLLEQEALFHEHHEISSFAQKHQIYRCIFRDFLALYLSQFELSEKSHHHLQIVFRAIFSRALSTEEKNLLLDAKDFGTVFYIFHAPKEERDLFLKNKNLSWIGLICEAYPSQIFPHPPKGVSFLYYFIQRTLNLNLSLDEGLIQVASKSAWNKTKQFNLNFNFLIFSRWAEGLVLQFVESSTSTPAASIIFRQPVSHPRIDSLDSSDTSYSNDLRPSKKPKL